jgi:hypothetical protein
MTISPLPPSPDRTDPATFSDKADAFVGALPQFVTQANALAIDVNNNATAAAISATDAEQAAAAAVAVANVEKWESGKVYDEGDAVYSPIDFLTYRRKSAGSSTTDPSLDSTNWALVAGTGNVTLDGEQTLENKTLTAPEFTGAIYNNGSFRGNVVSVAALDIDLSAGNYFTKSISANSTFTFSGTPASRAFGFTLRVTVTGDIAITWPASVEFPGDEAPTLTASKTHLFMFVTDDGGTTFRGAFLADYEA